MLCPCTQGLKRPRCTCKDFEAVAAENGSIFDEAMHTCTCGVDKTFGKCGNALHIKALDYRAGTFEALKELGRARRDAEWMLELSPRMPDVHFLPTWPIHCQNILTLPGLPPPRQDSSASE